MVSWFENRLTSETPPYPHKAQMIDRKVLAKMKGGGGQRGWEEQPSKGTQQDICKSKTKQNITKKQTNKKPPVV